MQQSIYFLILHINSTKFKNLRSSQHELYLQNIYISLINTFNFNLSKLYIRNILKFSNPNNFSKTSLCYYWDIVARKVRKRP